MKESSSVAEGDRSDQHRWEAILAVAAPAALVMKKFTGIIIDS